MEYDEKNGKILFSEEDKIFFKQMAEISKKQYLFAIENAYKIISNKIKDKQIIEQGLDLLFEFLDDERALLAYRKLCRHYWFIDKNATAEYIQMYVDEYDPNHEKFGNRHKNKEEKQNIDNEEER